MQVLISSNKFLKGFDCTDCFEIVSKNRIGVLVKVPFEKNSEFCQLISAKGLKVIDVKISD